MSLSYEVGAIIRVASRTWPGINKPGGVGKVTKIDDEAKTINVKYVLGGNERKIDWKFVSTNAFGDSCNIGIGDGTFSTGEDRDILKTKSELNEAEESIDSKRAKIKADKALESFSVYYDANTMEDKSTSKTAKKLQADTKTKCDLQYSDFPSCNKKVSEESRVALLNLNVQNGKVLTREKPSSKKNSIKKTAKQEEILMKQKNIGRKSKKSKKKQYKESRSNVVAVVPLKSESIGNKDCVEVFLQDEESHINNDDDTLIDDTIDETRLELFMPLLIKAMNSDSATISAIVEISNTSKAEPALEFTDPEIRSILKHLNDNNIIYFHEAENTVYPL